MTYKKANKLLKEIFKEEPAEIGIFISLLSYELIQRTGDTNTQFLKRLRNSLKIIKEEEQKETLS